MLEHGTLALVSAERPWRWLVTGAAGFIGSHLVEELLQRGQMVVGLDNFATGSWANLDDVRKRVAPTAWQRFLFSEGDICAAADCRRACEGVAVVLHQAALGSVPRSIADPRASHQSNVSGFLELLLAAKEAGVQRLVYASSSSVYGDSPTLPKQEQHQGQVLSPYAATKAANELYAQAFGAVYGMEIIGLRYFNVFGPRQHPDGPYAAVIPRWIKTLLAGEAAEIYGDGGTNRDFCYVANAVQANLLAAVADRAACGAVYNVSYGQQCTLNELFALIVAALEREGYPPQRPQPAYRPARPGDIRASLADTGKAQEALGYAPQISLAEGLGPTVKAFLRQ